MSLIRSLNSGVSGLKSFQSKMDVIGNNIANVETTGFKSSRVSFAEMMNQRLGRSGGGGESSPQLNNQVGLGVRVASIDRNFSQGALQNTGVGTDLAIEGNGYFIVNEGGENLMTRAGNFVFNKNGFLVDQAGRFVQGYNGDNAGNILTGGATEAIQIDEENALPPQQTDNVTLAGNLNANTSTTQVLQAQSGFTLAGGGAATETTDLNDLSQTTDALDATSVITLTIPTDDAGGTTDINFNYGAGNDGTTLGDLVDHINTEIDNLVTGGTIDEEYAATASLVDGLLVFRSDALGESGFNVDTLEVSAGAGDVNFPAFQIVQEGSLNTQTMSTTVYDDLGRAHSLILEFEQTGENEWEYTARFLDGEEITAGDTGQINFDETGQLDGDSVFTVAFEPGGGASDMTFEVSLGDSGQGIRFTQYAGSSSAKVLNQDGYAQGSMVDVEIDSDGRIQGIYDNGKSMVLAQLALAQVQNDHGLEMVGSGLFRSTSAAGEVFIDTAENYAETSISSGTLEGSNVDLAKEFTDMITSQRAYQSSARVITTSDEMLTEAVNLKR